MLWLPIQCSLPKNVQIDVYENKYRCYAVHYMQKKALKYKHYIKKINDCMFTEV